ncbi:MAG: zinc ribbon domain-containing protein [Deltaproteobacteria bacterium]|nr:zinc ribbon domain-containing protein [Deltaproteobacteria bacterium]
MPIYEYRCLGCKKVFSFLVGVVADSGEPVCPKCGGKELQKLISRVARIRSQEAVLEDLADPDHIADLEDPRAMARWAKKMGKTLGDEAGEDFGAELDAMLENPEGTEGEPDEE